MAANSENRILIFTKIRLHFAIVCASGTFFTVYLITNSKLIRTYDK